MLIHRDRESRPSNYVPLRDKYQGSLVTGFNFLGGLNRELITGNSGTLQGDTKVMPEGMRIRPVDPSSFIYTLTTEQIYAGAKTFVVEFEGAIDNGNADGICYLYNYEGQQLELYTDGSLRHVITTDAVYPAVSTSANAVSVDKRHVVVVTFDGTTNIPHLFLDGIDYDGAAGSGTVQAGDGIYYLGINNNPYYAQYKGIIKSAYIFKGVLQEAREISENINLLLKPKKLYIPDAVTTPVTGSWLNRNYFWDSL